VAKRNVPPADTWLEDFRESAGLTPPPRTLSNAASRLVDLMDEFLYSLQLGWEIPPGFPPDRFVPTGYGKSDLVAPIVQYLDDFSFTGDARRLHEAARQFYAHRDWQLKQMFPGPDDDKGWQEFQERCVKPLAYLSGCLHGVMCDVRRLIIDAAAREAATQTRGKGGRKKGSGVKLSNHERDCISMAEEGKKPREIDEIIMKRQNPRRGKDEPWLKGTAALVIRAARERGDLLKNVRIQFPDDS